MFKHHSNRNEPMSIVVETWKLDNQLISRKVIDYSKAADRKWLAEHASWSLMHYMAVVTYHQDDDFQFRLFNSL